MSAGEMWRRGYRGGGTRSGRVRRGAGPHWSATPAAAAGGLPATELAFELMEEENHGGRDVVGGGPAAAVLEPGGLPCGGPLAAARWRKGGEGLGASAPLGSDALQMSYT